MDRRHRMLVVSVVLSLGVAACSSGTASPETSSVSPEGSSAPSPSLAASPASPVAKVPVVQWMDAVDFTDAYTKDIVDVFNAQSTLAELQVVPQANGLTATRTALAAGQGPDIVYTDGPSVAANLAQAGQLLALDTYAQSLGWNDRLIPWATAVSKVNGQLYSIPAELETLVVYYNKDLFAKNGWTVPTTVDELTALAQKVDAAGVIPFAHANSEYKGADAWYVSEFLNHVAGPLAVKSALNGTAPWTADGMVESISLLNTYQQNGWFMGGLDKYYTTTFAAAHEALASGKAAMDLDGTWFLGDIKAAFEASGQNLGWFPMPSKDGTPILDLSIGNSLSINKSSAHPDAAAEFVTWLLSPAGQYQTAVNGTNPHPVPADPHVMSALDPMLAEILGQLADLSAKDGQFGYTDWTFAPPKSDDYLNTQIENVWAGQLSPADYLNNVQGIFDKEKAAGPLLPVP